MHLPSLVRRRDVCPFAQGRPVRNRDAPSDKASVFVDGKEDASGAIRFSKFCEYTGGLYLNDSLQEVKPPGVVVNRLRFCKYWGIESGEYYVYMMRLPLALRGVPRWHGASPAFHYSMPRSPFVYTLFAVCSPCGNCQLERVSL